ncbi:MAG: helix-turn-helix transcriptional regulator [Acidobacteria bacterium]|nr:helix-turn-helix transcriptional regulator [Acidobacteriota bacterium]
MTVENIHWTADSTDDFQYRIAMDFVVQLEKKMDAEGINQKELARRLKVSVGRVSQVLNDPGRLNLKSIVHYARALGMKAAIIAYDDNDPFDIQGPVNSEIFSMSWQRAGSPRTLFDLEYSALPHAEVWFTISELFLDWKNWKNEPLTPTFAVKGFEYGSRWDRDSATQPPAVH